MSKIFIKAKRKQSLRGMALFTVLLFTLNTIAFSAPPVPLASEVKPTSIVEMLEIPKSLGTIDSRVHGIHKHHLSSSGLTGGSPLIVFLQDAHAQPEAQEKTKAILEHLHKQHGFDLVLLEGGFGKLEPQKLELLKDSNQNQQVVKALFEKGEVGGPELFLLQNKIKAYGIEEEPLYWENLLEYQKVFSQQNQSEAFLESFERELNRLASRMLSKELYKFVREWMLFDGSKRETLRHLGELKKTALRVLNLDLEDVSLQRQWPYLIRLFKLQEFEKKQNSKKIRSQKKKLRNWLRDHQLDSTWLESQSISREQIELFYEQAAPFGFQFQPYEDLFRSIAIQAFEQEIKADALFAEVQQLTDQILTKLSQSQEEQKLIRLFRDYQLLQRLFSLELIREQYEKIMLDRERYQPEEVIRRLKKIETDPHPSPLPPKSERGSLKTAYQAALSFYDKALQRDRVMVQKALSVMKQEQKSRAVLVAGGFHTQGLLQGFEENSISYLKVMPRMTSLEKQIDYKRIMMAELSPVMSSLRPQNGATLLKQGSDSRPRGNDRLKTALYIRGLSRANLKKPLKQVRQQTELYQKVQKRLAMELILGKRSAPALSESREQQPWLTHPHQTNWERTHPYERRFAISRMLREAGVLAQDLIENPEIIRETPLLHANGQTLGSLLDYYEEKVKRLGRRYHPVEMMLYEAGVSSFDAYEEVEERESLVQGLDVNLKEEFAKIAKEIDLPRWLKLFETNQAGLFSIMAIQYKVFSRSPESQEALAALLSEAFWELNKRPEPTSMTLDDVFAMEEVIGHFDAQGLPEAIAVQIRLRTYKENIREAAAYQKGLKKEEEDGTQKPVSDVAMTRINQRLQARIDQLGNFEGAETVKEIYASTKKFYESILESNYQRYLERWAYEDEEDEMADTVEEATPKRKSRKKKKVRTQRKYKKGAKRVWLSLAQLEAIHFAIKNESVIVGDEMGVGKTPVGLAIFNYYKALLGKEKLRAVVVAPKPLLLNWEREHWLWGGDPNAVAVIDGADRLGKIKTAIREGKEIIVLNFDLLRDPKNAAIIQTLNDWKPHLKLGDEAHVIRNYEPTRKKPHFAEGYLKTRAEHTLDLSGTPFSNNVGDLWPLMRDVYLSLSEPKKQELYTLLESHGIDRKVLSSKRVFLKQFSKDSLSHTRLNLILNAAMFLRRQQEDVMDLPTLHPIQNLEVVLDEQQNEVTQEYVARYDDLPLDRDFKHFTQKQQKNALLLQTRLRQITMDLELLNHGLGESRFVHPYPPKYKAAVQRIIECIEKGEKIMVHSEYVLVANKLRDILELELGKYYAGKDKPKGYTKWNDEAFREYGKGRAVAITGEVTDMDARYDAVEAFQKPNSKIDVFISTSVGSEGLTLTAANNVIFMEPLGSPAKRDQKIGRVRRHGQDKEINVWVVYAPGTVDDAAVKRMHRRELLHEAIIQSKVAAQKNADSLAELSDKKVREISDAQRLRTLLSDIYHLTKDGDPRGFEMWGRPEFAKLYSDNIKSMAAYPIAQAILLYLFDLHKQGKINLHEVTNVLFAPSGPYTDIRAWLEIAVKRPDLFRQIKKDEDDQEGLSFAQFALKVLDLHSEQLKNGREAIQGTGVQVLEISGSNLVTDHPPMDELGKSDLVISSEPWGWSQYEQNSHGVGWMNWSLANLVNMAKPPTKDGGDDGGLVLIFAHNKSIPDASKQSLEKSFGLKLIDPDVDTVTVEDLPGWLKTKLEAFSFVIGRRTRKADITPQDLTAVDSEGNKIIPDDAVKFVEDPQLTASFYVKEPPPSWSGDPTLRNGSLVDHGAEDLTLIKGKRDPKILKDDPNIKLIELRIAFRELLFQKDPPESFTEFHNLISQMLNYKPNERYRNSIADLINWNFHQRPGWRTKRAELEALRTRIRKEKTGEKSKEAAAHTPKNKGTKAPGKKKKKPAPKKKTDVSLERTIISSNPNLRAFSNEGFQFVYASESSWEAVAISEGNVITVDPHLRDHPDLDHEERQTLYMLGTLRHLGRMRSLYENEDGEEDEAHTPEMLRDFMHQEIWLQASAHDAFSLLQRLNPEETNLIDLAMESQSHMNEILVGEFLEDRGGELKEKIDPSKLRVQAKRKKEGDRDGLEVKMIYTPRNGEEYEIAAIDSYAGYIRQSPDTNNEDVWEMEWYFLPTAKPFVKSGVQVSSSEARSQKNRKLRLKLSRTLGEKKEAASQGLHYQTLSRLLGKDREEKPWADQAGTEVFVRHVRSLVFQEESSLWNLETSEAQEFHKTFLRVLTDPEASEKELKIVQAFYYAVLPAFRHRIEARENLLSILPVVGTSLVAEQLLSEDDSSRTRHYSMELYRYQTFYDLLKKRVDGRSISMDMRSHAKLRILAGKAISYWQLPGDKKVFSYDAASFLKKHFIQHHAKDFSVKITEAVLRLEIDYETKRIQIYYQKSKRGERLFLAELGRTFHDLEDYVGTWKLADSSVRGKKVEREVPPKPTHGASFQFSTIGYSMAVKNLILEDFEEPLILKGKEKESGKTVYALVVLDKVGNRVAITRLDDSGFLLGPTANFSLPEAMNAPKISKWVKSIPKEVFPGDSARFYRADMSSDLNVIAKAPEKKTDVSFVFEWRKKEGGEESPYEILHPVRKLDTVSPQEALLQRTGNNEILTFFQRENLNPVRFWVRWGPQQIESIVFLDDEMTPKGDPWTPDWNAMNSSRSFQESLLEQFQDSPLWPYESTQPVSELLLELNPAEIFSHHSPSNSEARSNNRRKRMKLTQALKDKQTAHQLLKEEEKKPKAVLGSGAVPETEISEGDFFSHDWRYVIGDRFRREFTKEDLERGEAVIARLQTEEKQWGVLLQLEGKVLHMARLNAAGRLISAPKALPFKTMQMINMKNMSLILDISELLNDDGTYTRRRDSSYTFFKAQKLPENNKVIYVQGKRLFSAWPRAPDIENLSSMLPSPMIINLDTRQLLVEHSGSGSGFTVFLLNKDGTKAEKPLIQGEPSSDLIKAVHASGEWPSFYQHTLFGSYPTYEAEAYAFGSDKKPSVEPIFDFSWRYVRGRRLMNSYGVPPSRDYFYDGVIVAFKKNEKKWFVALRSVDNTLYAVETNSEGEMLSDVKALKGKTVQELFIKGEGNLIREMGITELLGSGSFRKMFYSLRRLSSRQETVYVRGEKITDLTYDGSVRLGQQDDWFVLELTDSTNLQKEASQILIKVDHDRTKGPKSVWFSATLLKNGRAQKTKLFSSLSSKKEIFTRHLYHSSLWPYPLTSPEKVSIQRFAVETLPLIHSDKEAQSEARAKPGRERRMQLSQALREKTETASQVSPEVKQIEEPPVLSSQWRYRPLEDKEIPGYDRVGMKDLRQGLIVRIQKEDRQWYVVIKEKNKKIYMAQADGSGRLISEVKVFPFKSKTHTVTLRNIASSLGIPELMNEVGASLKAKYVKRTFLKVKEIRENQKVVYGKGKLLLASWPGFVENLPSKFPKEVIIEWTHRHNAKDRRQLWVQHSGSGSGFTVFLLDKNGIKAKRPLLENEHSSDLLKAIYGAPPKGPFRGKNWEDFRYQLKVYEARMYASSSSDSKEGLSEKNEAEKSVFANSWRYVRGKLLAWSLLVPKKHFFHQGVILEVQRDEKRWLFATKSIHSTLYVAQVSPEGEILSDVKIIPEGKQSLPRLLTAKNVIQEMGISELLDENHELKPGGPLRRKFYQTRQLPSSLEKAVYVPSEKLAPNNYDVRQFKLGTYSDWLILELRESLGEDSESSVHRLLITPDHDQALSIRSTLFTVTYLKNGIPQRSASFRQDRDFPENLMRKVSKTSLWPFQSIWPEQAHAKLFSVEVLPFADSTQEAQSEARSKPKNRAKRMQLSQTLQAKKKEAASQEPDEHASETEQAEEPVFSQDWRYRMDSKPSHGNGIRVNDLREGGVILQLEEGTRRWFIILEVKGNQLYAAQINAVGRLISKVKKIPFQSTGETLTTRNLAEQLNISELLDEAGGFKRNNMVQRAFFKRTQRIPDNHKSVYLKGKKLLSSWPQSLKKLPQSFPKQTILEFDFADSAKGDSRLPPPERNVKQLLVERSDDGARFTVFLLEADGTPQEKPLIEKRLSSSLYTAIASSGNWPFHISISEALNGSVYEAKTYPPITGSLEEAPYQSPAQPEVVLGHNRRHIRGRRIFKSTTVIPKNEDFKKGVILELRGRSKKGFVSIKLVDSTLYVAQVTSDGGVISEVKTLSSRAKPMASVLTKENLMRELEMHEFLDESVRSTFHKFYYATRLLPMEEEDVIYVPGVEISSDARDVQVGELTEDSDWLILELRDPKQSLFSAKQLLIVRDHDESIPREWQIFTAYSLEDGVVQNSFSFGYDLFEHFDDRPVSAVNELFLEVLYRSDIWPLKGSSPSEVDARLFAAEVLPTDSNEVSQSEARAKSGRPGRMRLSGAFQEKREAASQEPEEQAPEAEQPETGQTEAPVLSRDWRYGIGDGLSRLHTKDFRDEGAIFRLEKGAHRWPFVLKVVGSEMHVARINGAGRLISEVKKVPFRSLSQGVKIGKIAELMGVSELLDEDGVFRKSRSVGRNFFKIRKVRENDKNVYLKGKQLLHFWPQSLDHLPSRFPRQTILEIIISSGVEISRRLLIERSGNESDFTVFLLEEDGTKPEKPLVENEPSASLWDAITQSSGWLFPAGIFYGSRQGIYEAKVYEPSKASSDEEPDQPEVVLDKNHWYVRGRQLKTIRYSAPPKQVFNKGVILELRENNQQWFIALKLVGSFLNAFQVTSTGKVIPDGRAIILKNQNMDRLLQRKNIASLFGIEELSKEQIFSGKKEDRFKKIYYEMRELPFKAEEAIYVPGTEVSGIDGMQGQDLNSDTDWLILELQDLQVSQGERGDIERLLISRDHDESNSRGGEVFTISHLENGVPQNSFSFRYGVNETSPKGPKHDLFLETLQKSSSSWPSESFWPDEVKAQLFTVDVLPLIDSEKSAKSEARLLRPLVTVPLVSGAVFGGVLPIAFSVRLLQVQYLGILRQMGFAQSVGDGLISENLKSRLGMAVDGMAKQKAGLSFLPFDWQSGKTEALHAYVRSLLVASSQYENKVVSVLIRGNLPKEEWVRLSQEVDQFYGSQKPRLHLISIGEEAYSAAVTSFYEGKWNGQASAFKALYQTTVHYARKAGMRKVSLAKLLEISSVVGWNSEVARSTWVLEDPQGFEDLERELALAVLSINTAGYASNFEWIPTHLKEQITDNLETTLRSHQSVFAQLKARPGMIDAVRELYELSSVYQKSA